ncbi:MAG: hypothetical protein JO205_01340 [Pseudolabrys sp.]|nr:hypothetical protein [Pseudolabrys sp.]MBV9259992.1 hypothetical protein [Pseudolabrys sp.]
MRKLILGAALAAATFAATSSANAADFRVIKWSITGVCQIYDFSWGFPPIPGDYRKLTPSLPTFAAALSAKDRLARRGRCTL